MKKPHLTYKNQTPKERTWTIHFLSIFKLIKGLLLLIVAVKLVTLINKDVGDVFDAFIERNRIDPDNRIVHSITEKISGIDSNQMKMFSVGSFSYAGLLLTEGIGLWMQKRWAEFLTVIATSLLIPIEIYEIYEKFTWVRIAVFVLNLFVVWYLVNRLRNEKNVAETEKLNQT